MRLLVLFLFTSMTGCALVNQKLNPDIFYQRDIQLEINGEKFEGTAVPKRADKYEIKIKAKGKIDMLTVTSCHREDKFEEPSAGWFSSGKQFVYNYKPIPGLEDGRGCLLDIGAYEKIKGRHAWATIQFQTASEKLPAEILCDGSSIKSSGVSICQAKAGLLQKIVFPRRVKVSPDSKECDVMKTTDELTYTYEMPLGECNYYFVSKDSQIHGHTTLGYQSILIRGAQ